MSQLFAPLSIKKLSIRNRIVVSPMCQYSSVDGFANDWHLVHLGSRAVGGAGLVFMEATAVSPEGRITPDDLGIWQDEHVEGLKRIVDFIMQQGAVAGIQLAHAGRKASVTSPWKGNKLINKDNGGWQPMAPSTIAFKSDYGMPHPLEISDIWKIVKDFKAATLRAIKAGFQVIEIHAAHGYLIHEFLSPLSNTRKDEYGGSFENRIRLLLDVVKGVRQIEAEAPLFVRISATDWVEGGWTKEDSIQLAQILKEKEVDVIDCSTGGLIPYAKIPSGPSYQVPFSQAVRDATGMLTGAVGIITDPIQAEAILVTGQADLIFMAREMLRDPYFPLRAADKLRYDEMPWPIQYERAKRG